MDDMLVSCAELAGRPAMPKGSRRYGLAALRGFLAARRKQARFRFDLKRMATDNPYLICYSKQSAEAANTVLTVVNLDPFHVQSGWVDLNLSELGLNDHESFQVHDQLTDQRYLWQGPRNYVELSPAAIPAHIFRVLRKIRSEKDFDYYL